MHKVFFLSFLVFLSLQTAEAGSYRAVVVIDGDTLLVRSGDQVQTIRLIGIDAPEVLGHDGGAQADGRASAQFLQQLVQDKPVHLEADPSLPRIDSYGRTLAYLYRGADGLFVNREMVRAGYAEVFRSSPFRFRQEFLTLESSAKRSARGLWNKHVFTREWETAFSGVKYLGEGSPRQNTVRRGRRGE